MMRLQSAIEFLTTYSFLFLILAIMITILYFVTSSPTTTLPSQCTGYGGPTCSLVIFYSNTTNSYSVVTLALANSQSATLNLTNFSVRVSSSNSFAFGCVPNILYQGGTATCIAILHGGPSLGVGVSGLYTLGAKICNSAVSSQVNCTTGSGVLYGGSFYTSPVASLPLIFSTRVLQSPSSQQLNPFKSSNPIVIPTNYNVIQNGAFVASNKGYAFGTSAFSGTTQLGLSVAPFPQSVSALNGNSISCSWPANSMFSMSFTPIYINGSSTSDAQVTIYSDNAVELYYGNSLASFNTLLNGAGWRSNFAANTFGPIAIKLYPGVDYVAVLWSNLCGGGVQVVSINGLYSGSVPITTSVSTVASTSVFTSTIIGSTTSTSTTSTSSTTTSSTSTTSTTTVTALGTPTISPTTPTIDSGQSVTFTASWSGGLSTYTATWLTGPSGNTCAQNAANVLATDSGLSGTTDMLVVSPTTTNGYCVSLTDSQPVTANSAIDVITVNPALSAGIITPHSPSINNGQSVTLSSNEIGGTSTFTYAWYTIAGSSAPLCNAANVISGATSLTYLASPTSTNSYAYQVTDSATTPEVACSVGDTVTVNAALSAGAITPAAPNIDNGQSITLTSAPSGGTPSYSYKWYTIAGSTAPLCNAANVISGATSSTYAASPTATNSYTYNVVDSSSTPASACSAGDTVTWAAALSAGAITPSAPSINNGQSVTLNANPSGGTLSYTYTWYTIAGGSSPICNAANVISGATSATYGASPTSTNSYSYKVTDSATTPTTACSAGDTVTVNAALSAGAITPAAPNIDNGQSITLTSAPSGGTPSYSYKWYTIAGSSAPLCNTANAISGATSSTYGASPTSTNSYAYKVTDSATTPTSVCSAGDTVTVNAALSAGAITPAAPGIDTGQSVTLTSHASAGTPAYTYKWYTIAGSSAPLCNTANAISGATSSTYGASPTATNSYTYNVVDSSSTPASACSAGDTITVNAVPSAGAITPAAPGIDTGQSVTLTSHASAGTPAYTYKWYTIAGSSAPLCNTANAISGATSSTYAASPSSTNSYTYNEIDSSTAGSQSSCSAGDTVTVNSVVSAGAITPATPSIDNGQSVTLTSHASAGTPPYTYQWYTVAGITAPLCNSANAISGATATTYAASPTSTNSYTYNAIDSSSAGAGTACSAGDIVPVNSALAAGAITESVTTNGVGGSSLLTSHASSGTGSDTYNWFSIAGASAPTCTTANAISGATATTYTATPGATNSYAYNVIDSAYVPTAVCSAGNTVTIVPLSLDHSTFNSITVAGGSIKDFLTTSNTPDVIYCAFGLSKGATVSSVSSSPSYTWTKRLAAAFANSNDIEGWYAVATASGAITVTATFSASDTGLVECFGVTGAVTSSPFDPHSGIPANTLGSGTSGSVSITTTNANNFLIGYIGINGYGKTFTPGTGYTTINSQAGVGGSFATEYGIVRTAQTANSVSWTIAGSNAFGIIGDSVT